MSVSNEKTMRNTISGYIASDNISLNIVHKGKTFSCERDKNNILVRYENSSLRFDIIKTQPVKATVSLDDGVSKCTDEIFRHYVSFFEEGDAGEG